MWEDKRKSGKAEKTKGMNKVVERLVQKKIEWECRKAERGNRRNKFTEMLLEEIKCRKAGESKEELRLKTLEDSAVKRWKKRKSREQKGTNITVERWTEQSTERWRENAKKVDRALQRKTEWKCGKANRAVQRKKERKLLVISDKYKKVLKNRWQVCKSPYVNGSPITIQKTD